ncbi:Envelope glycoprotein gp160 [Cymbomonas tetramitiformis]|uniref:Envelope glycoprotein gp160 n=1 Tax=Cymbomonas tetramitiformis TaxID=36881 RepID=A0AAE0FQP8_9CHLO|nr:Envelope glycoprotein gp160 [Cymbomonas tetramitiformis]
MALLATCAVGQSAAQCQQCCLGAAWRRPIESQMRESRGMLEWILFRDMAQDINEEHQREREDMLDTIRTLSRQMKLKEIIIYSFIPREETEKVKRRAVWEEEHECWILERLADPTKVEKMKRPVSAALNKRPVTDYAKIASAMGDQNPRFKSENILNLELDMPERTTYDYEGPGMNSRVQAALNAAFADEAEQLYAAGAGSGGHLSNVYFYGKEGEGGRDRPTSARRSKSDAKSSRPGSAVRKSSSGSLRKSVQAEDETPDPSQEFPEARRSLTKLRR